MSGSPGPTQTPKRSAVKLAAESVLPPVMLFALVLALWHAAAVVFEIPRYLLPTPADVWSAAMENRRELLAATWLTAQGALSGFGLSLASGTLIACAFSQSPLVRRSFYPYAVFLQTVPIVAIAPLIITWFGYGFQSVVLVAFIISVFPIITNGTTGMTAIDPDLLDLFRLYNASRWQVLLKLRLPNSVPYLIAGARISSGVSVIGAIVGEYFAGYGVDQFGLGYLILQTAPQMKTDELMAAVIASTVLGVAIFATVSIAGATILSRWYDSTDSGPK